MDMGMCCMDCPPDMYAYGRAISGVAATNSPVGTNGLIAALALENGRNAPNSLSAATERIGSGCASGG